MENRKKRSACLIAASVAVIIILVACLIAASQIFNWEIDLFRSEAPIETDAYSESFDSAETWMSGEGANAAGVINDGRYEMSIAGEVFDRLLHSLDGGVEQLGHHLALVTGGFENLGGDGHLDLGQGLGCFETDDTIDQAHGIRYR